MTERPILFSGPMVRALLAGKKTQTRRALKTQPSATPTVFKAYRDKRGMKPVMAAIWDAAEGEDDGCTCPYGVPGDRLWVRENGWQRPERSARDMANGADTWAPYYYDADGEDAESLREWKFKRRPSIHMPRWASRLWLEITAVRVQQLQAISDADAFAEGIDGEGLLRAQGHPPTAYRKVWEAINGDGSWADNPWVWVVEFKRTQ